MGVIFNRDVIKVVDTPANLSSNLKDQMGAFDLTGKRFAFKEPTNQMRYVSHDTLQALLAKANVFEAVNTFQQNVVMTAGKLLGLDQVSGFRLISDRKNTISRDDSIYPNLTKELLSVLGGDLHVVGENAYGPFMLTNPDMDDDENGWTFTGDWAPGTGNSEYIHSSGAGTIEVVGVTRHIPAGEVLEFIYDIDDNTSDAVCVIHDDFANSENVDLAVGTNKKMFFRVASNPGSSFKLSVTSTNGTFHMTNARLSRIDSNIIANHFGPNKSIDIDGDGNIYMRTETFEDTGFIGYGENQPGNFDPYSGLQFHKSGAARITSRFEVGGSRERAFKSVQSDLSTKFRIERSLGGNTVDVGVRDLDFPMIPNNGFAGVYLIYILGIKDDGTKVFSRVIQACFSRVGGTLSQVGSDNTVGAIVDEFGGATAAVSSNGDNIRVTCTGTVGNNINWSAQITGHGNLFSDIAV